MEVKYHLWGDAYTMHAPPHKHTQGCMHADLQINTFGETPVILQPWQGPLVILGVHYLGGLQIGILVSILGVYGLDSILFNTNIQKAAFIHLSNIYWAPTLWQHKYKDLGNKIKILALIDLLF